nr:hypothetical protein Iba_chr01aCG6720 [Ipomoea batatas]
MVSWLVDTWPFGRRRDHAPIFGRKPNEMDFDRARVSSSSKRGDKSSPPSVLCWSRRELIPLSHDEPACCLRLVALFLKPKCVGRRLSRRVQAFDAGLPKWWRENATCGNDEHLYFMLLGGGTRITLKIKITNVFVIPRGGETARRQSVHSHSHPGQCDRHFTGTVTPTLIQIWGEAVSVVLTRAHSKQRHLMMDRDDN